MPPPWSHSTRSTTVDFAYANYGNPFSFTAGTAVFGSYDGTGTQTNTPAELQQGIDLLGSWDYYQTQDNHTLATLWSGAQTTPFTAENAATIDRVTEIGIACPGLAQGNLWRWWVVGAGQIVAAGRHVSGAMT